MTEKRLYELVPYDCQDGSCLVIHEKTGDSKLGALSLDHKSIGEAIVDELNNLADENEQLNQKHRQLQISYNELLGSNTDYRELTYDLTHLIDDLGSEEMKRQMREILND